jgi:hypothetical protein
MTADLSALIAKLEAGPVYLTHKEAYDLAIFFGSDTALGMASLIRKAFAGGSLDASLALAEKVLPGWLWDVTTITTAFGDLRKPLASVVRPDQPEGEEIKTWGYASTPALALCIAILRAKQGEGE